MLHDAQWTQRCFVGWSIGLPIVTKLDGIIGAELPGPEWPPSSLEVKSVDGAGCVYRMQESDHSIVC